MPKIVSAISISISVKPCWAERREGPGSKPAFAASAADPAFAGTSVSRARARPAVQAGDRDLDLQDARLGRAGGGPGPGPAPPGIDRLAVLRRRSAAGRDRSASRRRDSRRRSARSPCSCSRALFVAVAPDEPQQRQRGKAEDRQRDQHLDQREAGFAVVGGEAASQWTRCEPPAARPTAGHGPSRRRESRPAPRAPPRLSISVVGCASPVESKRVAPPAAAVPACQS